MTMAAGSKFKRQYLAHYIDSSFGSGTVSYLRLGKDLEEFSIEMNPDVESKTNILGESSTNVKGYQPQASVESFYAYKGDELYEHLAECLNERETGSGLETTVVDVLVESDGTVVWAYRENVLAVPNSIGGSDGVQIPFEIYYNGNRTKGSWNAETKTFTAQTATQTTKQS